MVMITNNLNSSSSRCNSSSNTIISIKNYNFYHFSDNITITIIIIMFIIIITEIIMLIMVMVNNHNNNNDKHTVTLEAGDEGEKENVAKMSREGRKGGGGREGRARAWWASSLSITCLVSVKRSRHLLLSLLPLLNPALFSTFLLLLENSPGFLLFKGSRKGGRGREGVGREGVTREGQEGEGCMCRGGAQ